MLSFRIALRYLFAKKSHNAVNVISIVAVAGVAVATLATVCVLSVFNGFATLASGRLSLIDPDLKAVSATGQPIAQADSLAASLTAGEAARYVDAAVATLEEQALAIYDGIQQPVTLKGVGERYQEVCSIDSAIIDGVFALSDDYGYPAMTLSVGLAIDLGTHPDPYNPVALYLPRRKGRLNSAAPMSAFRTDSLLVAGVWQVEQSDYDQSYAVAGIDRVRRLLDFTDGEATAIEIALAPGADTGKAIRAIERQLGDRWKVMTRAEQQSSSFRMIAIEKWITFLMLAFILAIASFNIVSTLSMLIIEKRDNMQTLRYLGATPATTGAIFFWEGWLISMLGGIAGIAGGVGLCLIQQHFGLIRLNGDPARLTVSAYPVELQWGDLGAVMALVAVIGIGVGLIASRLARRI